MKRYILSSAACLCVFALVLVGLVNLRAERVPLPAPDPSTEITLPDGSIEPLAVVVERLRERPDDEADDEADAKTASDTERAVERRAVRAADRDELIEFVHRSLTRPDDLLGLGQLALREGRIDEALALLLSIEPDDRDYPRAQRVIGWNILTRELDQPERAVPYLHRSVREDPLSGNAWQDTARVYLGVLGVRWDPVANEYLEKR